MGTVELYSEYLQIANVFGASTVRGASVAFGEQGNGGSGGLP
jgi:hypothetical protein